MEFIKNFVPALEQELKNKGIEATVCLKAVEKLNNEGYDAVTVTPADSNIGLTFNVETFHKAYEEGASMREVVSRATDTIIRGFENQPSVDVAALTDYDQMRDRLVIEVISLSANEKMLSDIPYFGVEDLAVVYRFVIDSNDDGRATILVTNSLLETMGVTHEQLHEDALKNAPELKPLVIKGMSEVMAEMAGMTPEEMAMMGMPEKEEMFVASVSDMIHGAAVIAYPGFMEEASKRIGGGDFYILPSSIHEVLIVPDNGKMSLNELEVMVRDVNATQVAPGERLSDNVYHYDSQEKLFELGEKFERRISR